MNAPIALLSLFDFYVCLNTYKILFHSLALLTFTLEQILNDMLFIPIGFAMVGMYVVLMLGHLTCVENRVSQY